MTKFAQCHGRREEWNLFVNVLLMFCKKFPENFQCLCKESEYLMTRSCLVKFKLIKGRRCAPTLFAYRSIIWCVSSQSHSSLHLGQRVKVSSFEKIFSSSQQLVVYMPGLVTVSPVFVSTIVFWGVLIGMGVSLGCGAIPRKRYHSLINFKNGVEYFSIRSKIVLSD